MVKGIRYCVLIVFLFLVNTFSISAQNRFINIHGRVVDAKDKTPIPNVNIYLSNTTVGTATNNSGYYSLDVPQGAKYTLVFSYLGYQTRGFALQSLSNTNNKFDVNLMPRVLNMKGLQVVASRDREWENEYAFFSKEFLGYSGFSDKTTIENPEVLNFTSSKTSGAFYATADEPLIIINRALGYKVYVVLRSFSFNANGQEQNTFQTYPRYEELRAKNKEQEFKWISNRVKAYYGSFPHFLKSLYNDKLKENHFSFNRSRRPALLNAKEAKKELLRKGIHSPNLQKSLKVYKLKGRIKVNYSNTIRYRIGHSRLSVLVKKQASISPNKKRKIFIVYKNGKVLDTNSMVVAGDWGTNRIANSLPEDYSLKKDLKAYFKNY